MSDVRKIAFNTIYRVLHEQAYSALALNSAIKDNNLNSLDSSFLSHLVYGVIERKILLDHIISQYSKIKPKKIENKTLVILEMGIYQILFMDKVPDSAAVNESVKLSKKVGSYKSSGFINAVLRNFVRNDTKYSLPDESEKLEYLSVKYSCPEYLCEMWLSQYGEKNTLIILEGLSDRPPLTIRVNSLKTTKEALAAELVNAGLVVQNVDYLDNALNISGTGSIENLKSFKDGKFYVQDSASQLCSELLNAEEGMTVCDVCAAPGGKSLYNAIKMNNNGHVYSYDLFEHKVNLINESSNRLGIEIIDANVRDAQNKEYVLPVCDRLLCDVPCSGFGIIRRKPEIRYKKATIIDNLPQLQYSILCINADKLSIGGVLVYSTCTLCDKENIDIVSRFLAEHPDFEPYPLELPTGIKRYVDEPEHVLTLLPHRGLSDGFFIARFKKVGHR
ncbi:MAG: 16S rRNA (cytosine(967)-C(5))-methyltransferase RsmB [Ruminococcaceae bacterium]|nr:16S rRNA (cytosine(967)-C(5))-methyltransferase RsmB [Oscillospiraceae bacterium]